MGVQLGDDTWHSAPLRMSDEIEREWGVITLPHDEVEKLKMYQHEKWWEY